MPDLKDLISTLTQTVGISIVLCVFFELIETVDLILNWRSTADKVPMPESLKATCCYQPFVSLHVPLCREPVSVVENTLRTLSAIEYPEFEVVVVYNNTTDPNLWKPIAKLCTEIGPNFRFHYVRQLPGFKAGALNYALRNTSAKAEIIGVIDSDYMVDPTYLGSLTSLFSDQQVGFVQVPQDYVEPVGNRFARACYWEYWQFFEVGMSLRSLRNAAMLHGTMCLIRKQAILEAGGGWAEWCVTEDSELGLRLLALGYQGRYVKRSLGHGLVPFSFGDFKQQRWRWVVGGVQQLGWHLGALSTGHELSIAQKAHHLQGWLPWFRDALITVSLVVLGLASVYAMAPDGSPATLSTLGTGITSVLAHQVARHIIIYRVRLRLPWSQTIGASIAVLSLTFTIGPAWLLASLGIHAPFKVTPKSPALRSPWWWDVSLEFFTGAYVILITIGLLAARHNSHLALALVPLLYLPFIAPAFVMSFWSERAPQPENTRSRKDTPASSMSWRC